MYLRWQERKEKRTIFDMFLRKAEDRKNVLDDKRKS